MSELKNLSFHETNKPSEIRVVSGGSPVRHLTDKELELLLQLLNECPAIQEVLDAEFLQHQDLQ